MTDSEESFEELRARAEAGDADAQFNLGAAYVTELASGRGMAVPRGVPQDYVQAHMWLNLAGLRLRGENRSAAIGLGVLVTSHMTAEEIDRGMRLAREWARKSDDAAVMGWFDLLADVKGEGVPQDDAEMDAGRSTVKKKAAKKKATKKKATKKKATKKKATKKKAPKTDKEQRVERFVEELRGRVEETRASAEAGDANAQFRLGVMYATGVGVPQDDADAMRWYRRAAQQGLGSAQNDLGMRYLDGNGVTQNDTEALRWFRLAADQGGAVAQYNLGRMYANGAGVAKDDAEAMQWFRLAAEQGFASAQANIGILYLNGRGVAQDDAEALRWLLQGAEQGDAHGQYALGVMYEEGRGVAQDDAEALRWYRRAAEQGYNDAAKCLGIMYAERDGAGDVELAHMWFNLYALRNRGENRDEAIELVAQTVSFLTPEEISRSMRTAREWIGKWDGAAAMEAIVLVDAKGEGEEAAEAVRRKAAREASEATAKKAAAKKAAEEAAEAVRRKAAREASEAADKKRTPEECFIRGDKHSARGEYEEAVRYYQLAADQGDAKAQFNLGVSYSKGRGIPQDDEEAVRYYQLAADQGDAKAQFNLGLKYFLGRGVPRDNDEAIRWYRLAADQGHAVAIHTLDVMSRQGLVVSQDDGKVLPDPRLTVRLFRWIARGFKSSNR